MSAVPQIDVYPANPRYWQYGGRPVLLLGGSVEDNLFQISNLVEHLDALVAAGGNYVRCTMSCRDEGDVWPFARAGELYDLDQWNAEFWQRFEDFLQETARREVIVQVELWATFDYYRNVWDVNPFNPKNNSTYSAGESGLPTAVPTHPTRTENNFFWSVPAANSQQAVLKYQRRFVDRILEASLGHGHVLYCMDNETSVTAAWGAYWADYVRERAAEAGRKAHITEMWDPWDLAHPMHSATFDHPETYTFVDISQNNHNSGREHYEGALAARARVDAAPRPLTCVKTYGADGGRFGATRDGIERFWRNIFAGVAATRFHRPPSGIGLSEVARRNIRSARDVTDAFGIFRCRPRPDLLEPGPGTEAYCLANPVPEYALYFPAGGEANLDLCAASSELRVRWHDIDGCAWRNIETIEAGRRVGLTAPGPGQWAAVLQPA